MKRILSLIVCICLLALTLVSCLPSQAETTTTTTAKTTDSATTTSQTTTAPAADAIVYKIGAATTLGEPLAEAGQKFCDLANERLGGKIVFEYYPGEQLGNETTMFESMQVDLIQGMTNAFDSYSNFSKDLNIMSMAFSFKNHEHLYAYLESEKGQAALKKLEDQGMHILSYNFQRNPRCFFGKKPIKTPEDLAGVKFRIPNIPIFEKNIRQIGATPTVVAWSEYPYALIQGVVDAGESTYECIYAMGFHKSCPYITLVDYAYPLECISLSSAAWNRLNAEQQEIVQKCADEASEFYISQNKTRWEDDKKKIIAEGGSFVDFDKSLFIAKMAPLAAKLESEGFWDTPGLYDYVQSLAK